MIVQFIELAHWLVNFPEIRLRVSRAITRRDVLKDSERKRSSVDISQKFYERRFTISRIFDKLFIGTHLLSLFNSFFSIIHHNLEDLVIRAAIQSSARNSPERTLSIFDWKFGYNVMQRNVKCNFALIIHKLLSLR